MTCPNCHAEIGEGKKFCGKCGAPVSAAAAPQVGTVFPVRSCPKCGMEVQAGKRFCGRCGSALTWESLETQRQIPTPATTSTRLPSPALSATVTLQPLSPRVEENPCPHCGAPLRAGAKFCKQCGKSPTAEAPRVATPPLKPAQDLHVPPPAAVSRPPETALGTATVSPVADQAYHGPSATVMSGPPAMSPRAPTFSPEARQAHAAPPAAALAGPPATPPRAAAFSPVVGQSYAVPPSSVVSRPPATAPLPYQPEGKRGSLLVIAALSLLVLLGAAIGYVIYNRAASKQTNSQAASPANPGATHSVTVTTPTEAQSASQTPPQIATAPPEAPSASQASSQTAAATPQSVSPPPGTRPAVPAKPKEPMAAAESSRSARALPPYQQAHEKAEQAFAAERYIDPPDDSALFWARRAGELGDPEAPQIAQQVLSRMAQKVQQARAAHNYDLSVALLTKLAALYPDHPELQRLSLAAQQEQQDYARQLERQRRQQPR